MFLYCNAQENVEFLPVFRYCEIKNFRSFRGFAPRTPPALCPGPNMGLKALYLMAPAAPLQFLQLWKVVEKLMNCPGNVLDKYLKMCSKFCMNSVYKKNKKLPAEENVGIGQYPQISYQMAGLGKMNVLNHLMEF